MMKQMLNELGIPNKKGSYKSEQFTLMKTTYKDENKISHFPIAFRDIKIEEYSGSRILFCLKEVK